MFCATTLDKVDEQSVIRLTETILYKKVGRLVQDACHSTCSVATLGEQTNAGLEWLRTLLPVQQLLVLCCYLNTLYTNVDVRAYTSQNILMENALHRNVYVS